MYKELEGYVIIHEFKHDINEKLYLYRIQIIKNQDRRVYLIENNDYIKTLKDNIKNQEESYRIFLYTFELLRHLELSCTLYNICCIRSDINNGYSFLDAIGTYKRGYNRNEHWHDVVVLR